MIAETQLPEEYRQIVQQQLDIYRKGRSITVVNSIPEPDDIPLDNQKHWLRIPDVICVFVDMLGSTRLSAETHDKSTAGAYQLFTGTAVRLLDAFDAAYIDVRGDGVFALFDSDSPYRALAAAVTHKTFADLVFAPEIKTATKVEVGCHIGIDQRTVLVRRIGLRRRSGRTDRQNEVWAGRPVNMASKLASQTQHDQLLVSDRFYARLKSDLVLKSCGCPSGTRKDLWSRVDVSADPKFDFKTAYLLTSNWCENHGAEYCRSILALDKK